METRGFIPADWVWITPPLGGSANAVFHQEMIDFFIKPNFIASNLSFKDLE
jgi:nitric-oxide synthase